jgi:hypothetical protein
MGVRRALVVALIASGCGGAPYIVRGSREAVRARVAAASPDEVFGRTVRLTNARRQYFGELIACDRDWVYLRLHEAPEAMLRLAWRDGLSLDVGLPSTGPAMLTWTLVGSLSALSHGWWSLVSLPVWGFAGGGATAVSWNPRLGLESCERARPYARFPQGLPDVYAPRFDPRAAARPRPPAARAPALPAPALPAPWDAPAGLLPPPPPPPREQ